MNELKILILCVVSCVWEVYSDSKFLSSIDWANWKHLGTNDIKQLAVDNFIDDLHECPEHCLQVNKLENITTSIVPVRNVAEDSLNKFIGSKIKNIFQCFTFQISQLRLNYYFIFLLILHKIRFQLR